ncbi:MAG: efflux RND transporter periplasmic adaptor subunit [bacterium]
MMKRKLFLLLVPVVLIIGGFIFFRKGKKEPDYRDVRPRSGTIVQSISANGTVKPRNRLEIKPPFSGRLDRVLVKEGDMIKKGSILAWMSSQDRAALLDAARSKGAAELKKWEDVYKPTPIVAPMSGFIIKRSFESGQTVGASDAVLVMADNLIVQAQVDETDMGKLNVGQSASIILDAYPENSFSGKIEHIAYESQVVNNVTIYNVDILPSRELQVLRSGMSVEIEIKLNEKKNILILAGSAVQQRRGKSFVLVKTPSGSDRREIETGISDGVNIEIVSGLSEDDTVLVKTESGERSRGRRGLPGMSGR